MAAKFVVLAALVAVAQSVVPVTQVNSDSSSFSYDVADPKTGDYKSQVETRVGGTVSGQYSLLDADGTKRIVDYTADDVNGFNAIVRKDGAVVSTPVVAAAPAVVAARTVAAPGVYAAPPAVPSVYNSYVAPTVPSLYSSYYAPSVGAPSVYSSMGVPSVYSSVGAPSVYSSVGVPSVYRSVGVPSVYRSVGIPSVYSSVGVPSVYSSPLKYPARW